MTTVATVATIIFLHAHPDDECLASGGTIAKYAAEGHRVVLVTATDGRHGERPADIDSPEKLLVRRREELAKVVGILGIARHEWLGYEDSGMTGWPQNQHAGAFIRSDVEEAAQRFAAIVRDEQRGAQQSGARVVIVGYDWHGNYGHPDHIHVHKVARRAPHCAASTSCSKSRSTEIFSRRNSSGRRPTAATTTLIRENRPTTATRWASPSQQSRTTSTCRRTSRKASRDCRSRKPGKRHRFCHRVVARVVLARLWHRVVRESRCTRTLEARLAARVMVRAMQLAVE